MKIKVRQEMLLDFVIGLALLLGGLAWLLSNVYVMTPHHTGQLPIGGVYLRSGMLILPLIAGLLCWFRWPKRVWPKIVCGAGIVLIAVLMITSVTIRLKSVPLIKWIVILLMIGGGAVLTLRALTLKKR